MVMATTAILSSVRVQEILQMDGRLVGVLLMAQSCTSHVTEDTD